MSRQLKAKASPSRQFTHSWRIVWMSEWDQDYVDMEVPGFVTFESSEDGHFQFGLVKGEMDCRWQNPRVDFSWRGVDENDEVCGRGRAEISDNELHGHLYIHMGDDSVLARVLSSRNNMAAWVDR